MAATRTHRAADPFAARNLWLAGLGLAGIARRQSRETVQAAIAEGCRLRGKAVAFAGDARDVARGIAMTVGERLEPAIATYGARAEARIAPVLHKFGFATAPAARKRGTRRTGKTARR